MKIAGVVVLYNSPLSFIQNINTYLSQIDTLFAVDNSDSIDKELVDRLNELPNVTYISNNGNRGISYALNRAAERAIKEGYSHLLTMDDDSGAPSTMIAEMKHYLLSLALPNKIGIVSAAHSPATVALGKPNSVLYTMTSGNLLSLNAYQAVGPFREDFFIDHVDHEYNLRLNEAGYKVVELPTVRLNHPLGEKKQQWGVSYISHNPVRQYYMVRNGLIVARQYWRTYPAFSLKMIDLISKEWVKALFGQTNRQARIHFILKGIKDGFLGRTGKI